MFGEEIFEEKVQDFWLSFDFSQRTTHVFEMKNEGLFVLFGSCTNGTPPRSVQASSVPHAEPAVSTGEQKTLGRWDLRSSLSVTTPERFPTASVQRTSDAEYVDTCRE